MANPTCRFSLESYTQFNGEDIVVVRVRVAKGDGRAIPKTARESEAEFPGDDSGVMLAAKWLVATRADMLGKGGEA
jgi:hypothetical protein